MIRINGVGGWVSVMTVAAVSLIIGRQTMAQALGPSTAPLAPPVIQKEWFLVPLEVIEEVIEKIKEGTIEQVRYNPKTASLTRL